MVSSLENLSTSLTWVGHKTALVLVSNMAQQCALKIEYASAHSTLKLWSLRGLAHGVDRVCVSEALESASRGRVSGGRGAGGAFLPVLLIVTRGHRPTHQPSV